MLTSGSHVGLAASAAAVAAAYHEYVCVGLYLVMLACSRLGAVWQTVYKTRHLCILVIFGRSDCRCHFWVSRESESVVSSAWLLSDV